MPDTLLDEYRRWQRFQQQDRLDREHRGAVQKLAASGAMSSKVVEAYRSMAARAASEGACYRTLFERQVDDNTTVACEGWLYVRRVIVEGGTTRVRASLIETFTLVTGAVDAGTIPAKRITLELFDEIAMDRNMSMSCRIDRRDDESDRRFITFTDNARNYKALAQAE